MSNLRTAPSGPPINGSEPGDSLQWSGTIWVPRTPDVLTVPEVVGFVHADTVVRSGAAVSEWVNQRSGRVFEAQTITPPDAVAVDGRQWLQFHGTGVTGAGGSWMTCDDETICRGWRYLNQQASFWFGCVVQTPTTLGQYIVAAASNPAVTNQWQALITYLNAANRRAQWSGQNGGPVPSIIADVNPPTTDAMLVEVESGTGTPSVSNPGLTQSLRVNDAQSGGFYGTITDYGQLTRMTIGSVSRIEFSDPFGGYMRSMVWAYPRPSNEKILFLRRWLARDAGISLGG